MKKKQKVLVLNRETVRRLSDAQVQNANGAGRIRIPLGYDDNTEPRYQWVDDTNP